MNIDYNNLQDYYVVCNNYGKVIIKNGFIEYVLDNQHNIRIKVTKEEFKKIHKLQERKWEPEFINIKEKGKKEIL
jgi:hypothetical protein